MVGAYWHFKGRGMDFEELHRIHPVRRRGKIGRHCLETSRTGWAAPFVKALSRERDLAAVLGVDVLRSSASVGNLSSAHTPPKSPATSRPSATRNVRQGPLLRVSRIQV